MSDFVTVDIPGPSASRSKMQKKGWKCWAKVLDAVATPANDGYAYSGEFVAVGQKAELAVGAVILHFDGSSESSVGVVMLDSTGNSFISWLASTTAAKWAGTLANPARKLLAMNAEHRICYAAKLIAEDRPSDRTDKVQAYYEQLAGIAPAAQLDATIDTNAIAEQIKALIAGLSDEQLADVYRQLPGIEHRS